MPAGVVSVEFRPARREERQVLQGRIAGEVWALPAAAIGPLLATIPPPLGFGTVQLETGPCLGFLAEAANVEGQEEITSYGGWRAFIGR